MLSVNYESAKNKEDEAWKKIKIKLIQRIKEYRLSWNKYVRIRRKEI